MRRTVAILAGGAATRLGGRDKGLETIGGRPLIEWAVSRWHRDEAHAPILIVANRNLDRYARYGTVVTDATPEFRGPLAGVAAALAACETDALLTVPVDCPDPPSDLAERLAEAMAKPGVVAAVADDGERRQPLFAMYRRTLAASASDAAEDGKGVHAWQDEIGARRVDFADRRLQFHNLNTPDDFAACADAFRSSE